MNTAKGRLWTILDQGLFAVNKELLTPRCKCCARTLWNYERHLMAIGVWPLWDMRSKIAVATVLGKLKKFNFEAAADACLQCKRPYKTRIEEVIKRVASYFDGLCMTCMDRSKTKLADQKSDYWYHAAMDTDQWNKGCKFTHGEPT